MSCGTSRPTISGRYWAVPTIRSAGAEDVLGVVDMVDEAVQRRAPLHQPLLQAAPLVGRDDAGDQVERDQAFAARAVLVLGATDAEVDAHAPENHLGLGPAGLHQIRRLLAQPLRIALVMLPHGTNRQNTQGIPPVDLLHAT